jgi:hypothetical protein
MKKKEKYSRSIIIRLPYTLPYMLTFTLVKYMIVEFEGPDTSLWLWHLYNIIDIF